ncbi:hypothetical protein COOONC_25871, partial [Cooperia oncophora]
LINEEVFTRCNFDLTVTIVFPIIIETFADIFSNGQIRRWRRTPITWRCRRATWNKGKLLCSNICHRTFGIKASIRWSTCARSVINSCSYQGVNIPAYECCRNVLYRVPTTKGLCWMYYDSSMKQNSSSPSKQFSITFQMTRNSWYSEQTTPVHPGVDVYLRMNANDPIDSVNRLTSPLRLFDKKGVRLRMHKEVRADLRRTSCGQTLGEAQSEDRSALANNKTNLLMCLIMVSIRQCNCHPLLAKCWQYGPDEFRDFSLLVNTTQVCTIDKYKGCARRYIDLTRPSAWTEPIPNDILATTIFHNQKSLSMCNDVVSRNGGPIRSARGIRSTQDFVARLVLEYSTTLVTEVLVTKDPTLYELLSYIGYNLATWFAIGHIIWSLYTMIRNALCCSN